MWYCIHLLSVRGHLSDAEEVHREDDAARDEERVLEVQVLAQVEPLRQGVEQQEEAQACERALQQLLAQRVRVVCGQASEA